MPGVAQVSEASASGGDWGAVRAGRAPLWEAGGKRLLLLLFWRCAKCHSKQDPEGSNGNAQRAGGTRVGLAELVSDGWAVQALAVPAPKGTWCSEGDPRKGESTTAWQSRAELLSLGSGSS